jgi:excisionase family DNA binding protein
LNHHYPSHLSFDNRLLSTEEAARVLGVSKRTMEDWRLIGSGPVFRKLGNRLVRYAQADLRRYVDVRSAKNTSEAAGVGSSGAR